MMPMTGWAVVWLVVGPVACGRDDGVGPGGDRSTADTSPQVPSQVVVELDPAGPYAVPPTSPRLRYGEAVAVGSDLDKDGRLEWAVSAPHDPNIRVDDVPVAVYEGTSLQTVLLPVPREGAVPGRNGYALAAGGDTDGDGFGELLLAEQWHGFGAYIRVVRSMDPEEDVFLVIQPDLGWAPLDVGFQVVDGVDQPFVLSQLGPSRWRIDRFDLSGVGPGTTVLGGEETQITWEEPLDLFEPGQPLFADVTGDGEQELIFGTYRSEDEEGATWVCPGVLGLEVPEDCDVLAPGLSTGRFHEVGDLDGDGDLDIVAVASSTDGDDGEVWFLTAEGEVIAHLQGTRGNMLGSYPEYVVDDDGVAWVIVAEFNLYASEPTQAYRFRVSDLHGELTEADAETVWRTPGTSIGRQSAAYRETPDGPLQLILTEPYHGSGHVYLLPWP